MRSIAASFGFSLPPSSSSQAPSSDVTLVHNEPPAKRRKTIVEVAPTEPKEHDVPAVITAKATTVKKTRRQLLIEDMDDAPIGGDDSFIFGQRNKEKKRAAADVVAVFNAQQTGATREVETTKKPAAGRSRKRADATATQPLNEAVEEPPTGRPRRGAVKAAAMKVADGFVEENAPADRKRRDASPSQTAKAKKKQVVQQAVLPHEDVCGGAVEGPESFVQVPAAEKPKSRKRKAAAMVEAQDEIQQLPNHGHRTEACDNLPVPRVLTETEGKRRRVAKPPESPFATDQVNIDPVASTLEVMPSTRNKSKKRKAEEQVDGHEEAPTKRVKMKAGTRNRVMDEEDEDDAPVSQVKTTVKRRTRKMVADSGHAEPERLDVLPEGGYEPDAERSARGEELAARPAQRLKQRSRKTAIERTGAECALDPVAPIENHPAESAAGARPPLEHNQDASPPPKPQPAKPSRRRPLVDTDINLTIRSTSPEKPLPRSIPRAPHQQNTNETSRKPTPDHPTNPHRPSPPPPAKQVHAPREQTQPPHNSISQNRPSAAASRDRISMEQCPIDSNHNPSDRSGDMAMTRSAVPAARDAHQRGGSRFVSGRSDCGASRATAVSGSAVSAVAETLVSGPGAKPAPTTGAREPKRGRGPGGGREMRNGKVHEREAGEEERASVQDAGEDVDWLFDPPDVLRGQKVVKPKPNVKKTAAGSTNKSRTKMAEIDLDDLISNIASFAQQQVVVAKASRSTARMKGKV